MTVIPRRVGNWIVAGAAVVAALAFFGALNWIAVVGIAVCAAAWALTETDQP